MRANETFSFIENEVTIRLYKWGLYVGNKSTLKTWVLWDFWIKNTLWWFMKDHIFFSVIVTFLLWTARLFNRRWKMDRINWKREERNVLLKLDSISDAGIENVAGLIWMRNNYMGIYNKDHFKILHQKANNFVIQPSYTKISPPSLTRHWQI